MRRLREDHRGGFGFPIGMLAWRIAVVVGIVLVLYWIGKAVTLWLVPGADLP
jgi:hypothetical protein